MTLPRDWRIIDERVAGDSRARLGSLDEDETILCTNDGAIFARLYPSDVFQLKCIVNRKSLNIALNYVHSLELIDEDPSPLPRYNYVQFARFDLVADIDRKKVVDEVDYSWTF